MTHPHRYHADEGVNFERLVWDQVSNAVELPDAVQLASETLTITVGRRHVGYAFRGARMFLAGPAVDLTTATRARLTARRLPQRRAHIERETPIHPATRPDLSTRLFLLFDVDGTISADRTAGVVDFELSGNDLGAVGRYLVEPRIYFADGSELVPRHFLLTLIGSVVA